MKHLKTSIPIELEGTLQEGVHCARDRVIGVTNAVEDYRSIRVSRLSTAPCVLDRTVIAYAPVASFVTHLANQLRSNTLVHYHHLNTRGHTLIDLFLL